MSVSAALRETLVLEHLSCFPYDGGFAVALAGGTRTEAAVLLMGHLDVWAYVTQSQCAAFNGPTIAGVLRRADRSAAKPPQHGAAAAQATGAAGS